MYKYLYISFITPYGRTIISTNMAKASGLSPTQTIHLNVLQTRTGGRTELFNLAYTSHWYGMRHRAIEAHYERCCYCYCYSSEQDRRRHGIDNSVRLGSCKRHGRSSRMKSYISLYQKYRFLLGDFCPLSPNFNPIQMFLIRLRG